MPALSGTGVIAYNGFTFPLQSKTRVTSKPIPDKSNRAVKHISYLFDVSSYILAADLGNTDAQALNIRRLLTAKGGEFTYTGWGFTDLSVNAAGGTVKDVTYGPHPAIIEWTKFGPDNAWLIRWQCEVNIPDCGTTVAYSNHIIAHTIEWGVDVDEHGFSTRTVSGEVEIPGNRTIGSSALSDNADRYWDTLITSIPLLPGFRRSTSRRLSADQRSMSYTTTDVELPPAGFVESCTDWSGTQELSTSLADGGFRKYVNAISATYRVAREKPKSDALKRFSALVRSRVDAGRQVVRQNQFVPISFKMTDRLNNQEVSFALSWFYTCEPDVALRASGMWLPIPNSSWPQWMQSVANSGQHRRGNAKLFFDNASSAILDLCTNPDTLTVRPNGSPQPLRGTLTRRELLTPMPIPTWIMFEAWVIFRGRSNAIFHKPLGQPPTPNFKARDDGRGFDTPFAQGGVLKDIAQYPTAATSKIRLVGRALRASKEIQPPSLVAFGGRPVVLENIEFSQSIKANIGVPVYGATWKLDYRVLYNYPTKLPYTINPMLIPGTPGG